MNRLISVAVLLAAVGAVALLLVLRGQPSAPAADAAIGATIAVDPAATIASRASAPVTAQLTSPIHLDDLLATGPGGAIRVQFTDATFFSVGANASARVDSYVFDPGRGASKLSLAFLRGAFRFVSGPPLHANAGQPSIQTPVAEIGVRGTGLDGVIGPEAEALFARIDPNFVSDHGDAATATLILLTEGAIDVDGSGVRIAMEVPGQALFFRRRGAAPIGPVTVPVALRDAVAAVASPPELGPEPGARGPERPVAPPPSPSPSPTRVAPSPVATVEPVPVPIPSPAFTPQPTPTPQFTPRPRPTPRFTPEPTPTPRFTPRPMPTSRFTPRPFPTAQPAATPTPRPPRMPLSNRPRPVSSPTPGKQ
jgi:hypothetical protein